MTAVYVKREIKANGDMCNVFCPFLVKISRAGCSLLGGVAELSNGYRTRACKKAEFIAKALAQTDIEERADKIKLTAEELGG